LREIVPVLHEMRTEIIAHAPGLDASRAGAPPFVSNRFAYPRAIGFIGKSQTSHRREFCSSQVKHVHHLLRARSSIINEREDPHDAYDRLGWSLSNEAGRHLVDTFDANTFNIARIWSREGEYESLPEEGFVSAVLVVEGTISGRYSGHDIEINTGEIVVLDSEVPTLGKTNSASARFYWRVPKHPFEDRSARSLMGEPFLAASSYWHMLAAMSNTVIDNPVPRRSAGVVDMREAASHLLQAIIAERRVAAAAPGDLHRSQLLNEAILTVGENFHNASFTVPQLARRLRISESGLRRIFATIGTTPHAEIERRRLARAKELLILHPPRTAADSEAIAESAGFASRMHMQRTIRRERSREAAAAGE
jgi:AraC-like DNA-binding protein